MQVITAVDPTELYGGSFTGNVRLAMLRPAPGRALGPSDGTPTAVAADVALVSFADGAVTNWHTHPAGQLFWVVSGLAVVGSDADGERELEPGTLVDTPAGEGHWHGAATGHDAQLLCFTWGATAWTDLDPRHETRIES